MATRGKVSGVNRAIAIVLAVVWMVAGIAGLILGFNQGRMVVVMVALVAVAYSLLWFRVVARSRLLTWREFAAPWRT